MSLCYKNISITQVLLLIFRLKPATALTCLVKRQSVGGYVPTIILVLIIMDPT